MTRRLRSLLGRGSPWTRRAMVAALVLVIAGVAGSALTSSLRPLQPRARSIAGAPRSASTGSRLSAPSVSPVELARGRRAAGRFLGRYLPCLYGRASASSVAPATAGLRRELARDRASVTPVERRRHPRVVSLEAAGQGVEVVTVTALVEDGGVMTYAIRIALRQERSGWAASAVDGG